MHNQEYEKIVLDLKDKLYRFARWILQNNEDAEDVVQEVFSKLWQQKSRIDKFRSTEAFAMIMVKNQCLNQLKKDKRRESRTHGLVQADFSSPEKQTEYGEMKTLLFKIIAGLPDQQRMVMQLKSVEGLSIREIAEVLETTDNNTRVILSRARKQVKVEFEKIYGNGA